MNSNYNGLASSVFDPNAGSYSGYNDYTTSQYKRPSFLDSLKLGQSNTVANKTDNTSPMISINANDAPVNGETISSIDKTFQGLQSSNPASTGIMSNLTDWFGKQGNMNMLQGAMGLGGLGLGLASYLQQSKLLGKQGQLLDQQISNNSYEMGQRKRMNDALDAQHV